MKKICILLIRFYQIFISPILNPNCRFMPSCSNYAIEAIQKFGVVRGIILGAKRILRCNPFVKGGYDFVPDNPKGDMKWLF